MGEVESSVAAPASGREGAWRQEVDAKLGVLAEALDWHIAGTEGEDGLLTEILRTAPRLANRIDRARSDHVALRRAVDDARASAAASGDVSDLRDRIVNVLVHLARHRQLGSDLVYEAYSVDIEAAD